MIKLYDRVVLNKDLPDAGLISGDVGTVVEIYEKGRGYEVEFYSLDGSTLTVETILKNYVRPARKKDILHIRQYA